MLGESKNQFSRPLLSSCGRGKSKFPGVRKVSQTRHSFGTKVFGATATLVGGPTSPKRIALRKWILAIVTLFVIVPRVLATSITWHFYGKTLSSSQFNLAPIETGVAFEFRISLDTETVGVKALGLPEIMFAGGEGQVVIAGKPLEVKIPIAFVEYFAQLLDPSSDPNSPDSPRKVTAVEFPMLGKEGLSFSAPIAFLRTPFELSHLGPIGLSNSLPGDGPFFGNFEIVGPSGLDVFAKVTQFAAFGAAGVPEVGSTLQFLASSLIALSLLKRRFTR